MRPETIQWLRDALNAAELVERHSHDQTYERYLADEWFKSAVERQLEVIGEALNRAIKAEPQLSESLPEARGWIGLRNVLAHAYDHIRDSIVWDTVRQEIPALIALLEATVNESEQSDDNGLTQ